MDANALELIEQLRSGGVRDVDQFREAFEDHLLGETNVTIDRVRDAMATDATDATDFVRATLRTLRSDLTAAIDEREETVAAELEAALEVTRDRRSGRRGGRRDRAPPLARPVRPRLRLYASDVRRRR